MDAVQSSKFMHKRKSEDLIKKLEGLTSSANAKQLQRHWSLSITGSRLNNDSIHENVDAIHAAIHGNRQISLLLLRVDHPQGAGPAQKTERLYTVSPRGTDLG